MNPRRRCNHAFVLSKTCRHCREWLATIRGPEPCRACHATGIGGPDGRQCVSCGGSGMAE